MTLAKKVAAIPLVLAGRLLGPPRTVRSIRFLLNRIPLPEPFRMLLMWGFTTHMLPGAYTEQVALKNGVRMQVGLEDIVNRRLLYFSQQFDFCWEPETSRFISDLVQTRRVVVVGGAHIGYHAVLIAKWIGSRGEVHAFEPAPEFFERLQVSKSLNKFGNLHGNCAALTAASGSVRFHLTNVGSSVFDMDSNKSAPSVDVTAFGLDDYLRERAVSKVDLLLLDVEGAELDVLTGAPELIDRQHPDIIFEINRDVLQSIGGREADIYEFLRTRGYRLAIISDDYKVNTCAPPRPVAGAVRLVPIDEGGSLRWFNVYATTRAS